MEKITEAFEKMKKHQSVERMKMLVGMEVDDEESTAVNASSDDNSSFMDEFNRNCTLSYKQVSNDSYASSYLDFLVKFYGAFMWGNGVN
ncbi:Origin of replication complex subunit 4 [Bienertia sinuspersici]